MRRPLTAAQRTLTIPGVDDREQEDLAAVAEDGPAVIKVAFEGCGETTHYVRVLGDGSSLCGRTNHPVTYEDDDGNLVVVRRNLDKRVCLACLVEASRIGAVLR